MDYAVTLDQTVRVAYNLTRFTNEQFGCRRVRARWNAHTPPRTACTTSASQHFGPLGRRAFWRSRVQLFVSDTDTQSATEAPTIRVNDAFVSGGAQLSGGEHSQTVQHRIGLDYVRGRHSWRAGLADRRRRGIVPTHRQTIRHVHVRQSRRPIWRTSRVITRGGIGDRTSSYSNLPGGVLVQDDIRRSKNLTLSSGRALRSADACHTITTTWVRASETTWAPFASGQTTLRGSVGIFYDWLPNRHVRTGASRRRLAAAGVEHPRILRFPDPGNSASMPPINRYLLDERLQHAADRKDQRGSQ